MARMYYNLMNLGDFNVIYYCKIGLRYCEWDRKFYNAEFEFLEKEFIDTYFYLNDGL